MERCLLPSTAWDDFYDITTIKPVLDNFPEAEGHFVLINRDHRQFPSGFDTKLRNQAILMEGLEPPKGFDQFLTRKVGHFLKPQTIEWFMNFRHDPSLIHIWQTGGNLYWHAEGPLRKIWFTEIPHMATISGLFFQSIGARPDNEWEDRLRRKAEKLKNAGVKFVDFGTRRSFSTEVHERVVEILMNYPLDENGGGFISTSNMHLAMKHDLTPSGTMGHKLIMAEAGINGVQSANQAVMESWQREYKGNLGTFLPDTYTTGAALKDFDGLYARLFDSVRHDSGDPFWFTDLVIAHYKALKIDPTSKTVIFSDGLDADRAIEIASYCKGKIGCSFGIGTNLTNDVGYRPLNIVIKLDRVRKSPRHPWIPVVKLSDTSGKESGNPEMVAIVKTLLGIS